MIALQIDTRQLDKRLATIVREQPKKVQKALGKTASTGIRWILRRTNEGQGLKGAFKPYSENYALFRELHGRPTAVVDLNFFGDMQKDLAVTKLTASKAVISAISALEKKKIAKTDKQRPWFGFKPAEEKRLVRFFGKQL